MKSIALALSFLVAWTPTLAAEPEKTGQDVTVGAYQILFQPSKKQLLEVFLASRLSTASGIVLVAYDAKGNVLGVKLDKSTGSASLDSEIMAWAAQVKLKAASSGITSIPFEFATHK